MPAMTGLIPIHPRHHNRIRFMERTVSTGTTLGISRTGSIFSMDPEIRQGGEVQATAVGRDVIDDHYRSLTVLANTLGQYGVALELSLIHI